MEKSYRIDLKKKSNKGNVSHDVAIITPEVMITRHGNPSDTFKIYQEKKLKGEDVDWKRGILREKFPNKTSEEIRDHVIEELNIMKEKMKDEVEVKWEVEELK